MSHFEQNQQSILAYINILQNTIIRMNTNSAYCKLLCCSILVALGALSKISGLILFIIAILAIIACASADARYLSLERIYRNKYNITIKKYYRNDISENIELFDMNPGSSYFNFNNIVKSFKSWSMIYSYPVLLMYIMIVSFIE
jgi:hypothetical protein